jgi:type IV secretion system protein VirB10
MSESGTPLPDPDRFELRGRPRPVTRINRRLVFGVVMVAVFLVAALFVFALRQARWSAREGGELLNTETKPYAPGLDALPKRYDAVQPPASPEVAPAKEHAIPNPARRDLPLPADDQDNTRLSQQARSAGVFFQLRAANSPAKPTAPQQGDGVPTRVPGEIEPTGLNAFANLPPAPHIPDGANPTDPQASRLAFLKGKPEGSVYNPHGLQKPVSPYQIMAGTVIAASLLTGLNSDLPGFIIAQVTEPVYDTASGRILLIPQGSRLLGRYDARVNLGQDRALIVWQRVIRPDSSSIEIDNLPGNDAGGYAGLADDVDIHTWQLVKGIALASLLNVGTTLSIDSSDSDLVKALAQATGQTANRAGQAIVERQLNVQPTITIRPGWPLRVIVHKDLVLSPYGSNRGLR